MKVRSSHPRGGERFPDARAAPRYPIVASAEVIEPLSQRHLAGSISIISATGCFFLSGESVIAGTVVRLRIERNGNTFETWAQVPHVKAGEGMGLAFFNTAPAQMSLLERWIEEVAGAVKKS